MSLTALPVTVSDLTTLQSGIQFFTNTAEANVEVPSINANQPNDSVFIYATKLLANNISLSQVAMAVSALMEGGTIAVGNATTSNTLTLLSTVFLPGQVAFALANNFNPTVFAAESLGSALSTQTSFQSFVGLNASQFAQSVSTLTGVNVSAIQTFVANWQAFFTNNPIALQGRTVTQASYGAAFGDAVGVALLNPTTANLETIVSTTPGVNQFIPNTIQGLVANALLTVATGQYETGKALGGLKAHTDLQGEASVTQGGVFLTQNVDSPTAGFSLSPNGTPLLNGFTATQAGAIFQAPAFVTALGIAVNTLNSGDNLQDTVGDGTLNLQTVKLSIGANPPFATNVTMNGLKTANIANQAADGTIDGIPGGFQGNITGLLVENNNGSIAAVTLGGTGQGLKTLLTDININNYGGKAGSDLNTVILASAIGDATKTINVSFTGGNLGTTKDGGAQEIAISNDLGGGTKAAPNLTYGTWALTINNNANLQLEQNVTTDGTGAVTAEGNVGGVGGATTLSLAGKGNIALSQDQIGEWRLLKTLNAGGESGTVIIPGATAGLATNAFASNANPLWLFGGDFGFLNNTGTGDFALTEFDLGSGTNILDVSTATAAQIAALKTVPNATPSTTNTIVVQDSVATTLTATTFANIKGFQTLGIGGPTAAQGAAGTIDLALLPASINNITYFTPANGSVVINNQVAALTVDVKDETTVGQNLTVGKVGPAAGLNDSLTVNVGNANHVGVPGLTGGDALGDITAFGDELFTLNSTGGGAVAAGVANGANDIGGTFLVPTPGGNEQVKITGDTTLQMAVTHSINGAISSSTGPLAANGVLLLNNLSVTITNTAATEWGQGLAGSLLQFQTDNGIHYASVPPGLVGFAPVISYSNNAVLIDASASGGLISPWGDANFQLGATPALSIGDTIIGAANPVGYQTGGVGSLVLGDVLVGSLGNDNITSKSMVLPDYIITEGGADKITLAAGHTGADHVGFYAAAGNVNVAGNYAVGSVTGAITEGGAGAFEFANPGWWGLGTAAPSTRIDDGGGVGLFPGVAIGTGGGTSADNSTLTNYNPTQDFLDFSVKAWSTAGLIGFGLTQDTVAGLANAAPAASLTGLPVIGPAAGVGPGGNITATGTDFILLNNGNFIGAAAVAQALSTTYGITHSALGFQVEADFLLAYAGTDGNAHIANLHLGGAVAASTSTTTDFVTASDMVTLVGVTINQLLANQTHVHLVS